MKKKQKIKAAVISVLLFAVVLFIFAQSMDSRTVSGEKSSLVYQFLRPILLKTVGEKYATEHLVRKMAHFSEFGLLGVLTGHLLWVHPKRKPALGALFCLLVALSDETVQLFTERGSQVQDVWLDFSGAMVGMFGITVLLWLVKKVNDRRKC